MTLVLCNIALIDDAFCMLEKENIMYLWTHSIAVEVIQKSNIPCDKIKGNNFYKHSSIGLEICTQSNDAIINNMHSWKFSEIHGIYKILAVYFSVITSDKK